MKGQAHTGDDKTPAYNPGNKFAPKNLQEKDKIFDNQKVKDLMRTTGLHGRRGSRHPSLYREQLQDINPAIANQKDRTTSHRTGGYQNRPDPLRQKLPRKSDILKLISSDTKKALPKIRAARRASTRKAPCTPG